MRFEPNKGLYFSLNNLSYTLYTMHSSLYIRAMILKVIHITARSSQGDPHQGKEYS
jgi:hypothetical protein